ncbi:hypothetical protein F5Y12DRAFT_771797 [Xylaria sp. FL1777]|nr:hypothetical protein F5Y12DRAFT_771797 [Xylaria sp. FL1777]
MRLICPTLSFLHVVSVSLVASWARSLNSQSPIILMPTHRTAWARPACLTVMEQVPVLSVKVNVTLGIPSSHT